MHELIGRFGGDPPSSSGTPTAAVKLAVAARHPDDVGQLVLVAPAAACETKSTVEARYLKATSCRWWATSSRRCSQTCFWHIRRHWLLQCLPSSPGSGRIPAALLSVSMSPGNLAALADDRLEFNSAMEWLDAHVGDVRHRHRWWPPTRPAGAAGQYPRAGVSVATAPNSPSSTVARMIVRNPPRRDRGPDSECDYFPDR